MPELAEQNSRVSEKKEETANALGSSEYVKMLFGGIPHQGASCNGSSA